ncbi:CRISPR-associated endonuclease Cas1 [Stappia indica]|uniref:CRISPR-associated endonuclease Cas1 n=1 Tax=Stappia indica TaxID=538381 RepID=UPI00224BFD08|nr:CRISPR-associated endonuclease Cas1 [Stappia indica]
MGPDFRRDTDGEGGNSLLNYGYTVLRATVARAICSAGLHPGLGLYHSNRGNAFALADDLMEPYRPFVDRTVVNLLREGVGNVTPEAKRALVNLTSLDLRSRAGTTPLHLHAARLARDLAASFAAGKEDLDLPAPPEPLVLAGLGRLAEDRE